MQTRKKPFVLTIIDGFGYSAESKYNAISLANTPTWDNLWQNNPKCLLNCSGHSVGLPNNQMGNSEVGHMNISAGRVIYQDLTKIDLDIQTGEFFKNTVLNNVLQDTKQAADNQRALHVAGLISDGGVHSHINHFIALINLAKQYDIKNLYLHAFLDGRDTAPRSALTYLKPLADLLNDSGVGKLVSIIGRYYAMDRDQRWERTDLAYNLLINNIATATHDHDQVYWYQDVTTAINAAYERNESDEFIKPTIICNNAQDYNKFKIKNNDNFILMNFRSDRARQLSKKLVSTSSVTLNKFVTLTQYEPGLTSNIVYPQQTHSNMLGEYISDNNLTQLRIAETEKYAHVTFFFNGGKEQPFKNEDRVLVPSPKVSTYNLKPEMSAYELTDILCEEIESGKYDLIICNYANPDMVGHTGDLSATIKAIETIDHCLARVITALDKAQGQLFITADHGNAEYMFNDQTNQAHTAHTHSLVPLVYVCNNPENEHLAAIDIQGCLTDIAPSILSLMGLEIPQEMTGKILFR